jgi:hypothetical protein
MLRRKYFASETLEPIYSCVSGLVTVGDTEGLLHNQRKLVFGPVLFLSREKCRMKQPCLTF